MKAKHFVLDVNIWISYMLQRRLKELAVAILRYELTIFISPGLIAELEDVIGRPKIAKYLTLQKREYLDFIESLTVPVTPELIFKDAADPKDNYLFDLALATEASLVTGDKRLLNQKESGGVTIITLREFREMLENEAF